MDDVKVLDDPFFSGARSIHDLLSPVNEDTSERISRSWLPECTLLVRESQFGLFHDTLEFLNFRYLVPLFLRRLYV